MSIYVLVFVLLAVFLIHNFDSIGQDIGRHLKVGEIIWQSKEVPRTNLFSFTEPDFAFTNHHWLSEVIFFGIFSLTGFTGLILVKTFFVLLAFFLLFSVAKKHGTFWPIAISFLLSIFIFIQRTEVRPEFFSFAILAFFLWVLFKAKYAPRSDLKNPQGRSLNWLWFLPLAELLWVNLHIYFFIGPFLIFAFLIDWVINRKSGRKDMPLSQFDGDKSVARKRHTPSSADLSPKIILAILFLTSAATLINPSGLQGAFLPFNILKEYGYRIVENQTLAFLSSFFGFTWPVFTFKLSAAVLIGAFISTIKKTRQRIFEIIISVFFIYAGFKMLRNLPLYALASFPILSLALADISKAVEQNLSTIKVKPLLWISRFFKVIMVAFLIFMIYGAVSGSFYRQTRSAKAFGFSVPNGLERAADFVKENNIEGPLFNNFDIGGYLIWRLYPDIKVFVDNRPEAYSVKFFSEIYKPMQEDPKKWAELSEKYKINVIFFGHTDATPWGQAFLKSMVKNPDWPIVYLNENAVILVKNDRKNSEVISQFFITEKNATERVTGDNLVLSRLFYNFGWRETAIYFAQEAIKLSPKNPHARLYKGLAHALYKDKENQRLAADNIKIAIDLGLKDSQYYYILGVLNMNLGQLDEAERLFLKALELDKNNQQAKEFLVKYFNY